MRTALLLCNSCAGCLAQGRGPICEGCAADVVAVFDDEHLVGCSCAACATWQRARKVHGSLTLDYAREVLS